MNKVLIVIMFILLGTSLLVVSNMNKGVENSFTIEYQNNKNLALPDLEGKQEISAGFYRIYDDRGITVDYNVNNGEYEINGTIINLPFSIPITNYIYSESQYTLSYFGLSGYKNVGSQLSLYNQKGLPNNSPLIILPDISRDIIYNVGNYTSYGNNRRLNLYLFSGNTFNNYRFKIQLEKGQTATSYVVPKLIPIYKDNLTQQEKQEIGFGAFAGFTEIIRNINGFIKPIGNFINGILSWF